jgi:endonuclease/exonuclease/phosphatase family metal-dependent hydrolase
MRNTLALLLVLAGLASCAQTPEGNTLPPGPERLRVMTFNIRNGMARDGEHNWPARRDLVAERIRTTDPDVLALQEAFAFQLVDLADVLAGYTKIGQHREGGQGGEFSGLFVRNNLRVVDQGEFWFSESPEVPGSKSWDSSLPRMTAWVDLGFDASNRGIRIYGTHYDHRGPVARRRASEMIVAHAEGLERVIVMGDLNAKAENPPLRAYWDADFSSAVETTLPDETRGTFNGFRDETGGGRGRRIDFVLLRGALQAESAAILGGRVEGLFPSDHDAVKASVVLID